MRHDSGRNGSCSSKGFIMSIDRSDPKWSECNANIAAGLKDKKCLFDTDRNKHLQKKYPGKDFTLEDHCRMHLG